ncbi:hypothetical protein JOB18_046259, partial [Solea senegalensis]
GRQSLCVDSSDPRWLMKPHQSFHTASHRSSYLTVSPKLSDTVSVGHTALIGKLI